MKRMQGISDVYDEWLQSLEPGQAEQLQTVVDSAALSLLNVGQLGARELVISLLLFLDEAERRGSLECKSRRLP